MKSIEGLRDWAKHYNATGCRDIRMFADAIEAELAERYVALPLDADGEPIHVGDRMEVINGGLQAEACYMQIGPSGIWSVGLTKQCHWYDTESLRHPTPTVEDVLRAMLDALDVDVCDDPDATIAEYAKRLRLAGDGE